MGVVEQFEKGVKWHLYDKRTGKVLYRIKNGDLKYTHHLYACGLSGMGKTSSICELLKIVNKKNETIPFLIVEPTQSRQYRKLANYITSLQFDIYSIGEDGGRKLELNPFYIPYGMDFTGHIELLKACFAAALSSKEPLVYQYLERAIPEIYFDKGWDRVTHCHPELRDIDDYSCDEHYFYFPKMRDLYDKLVELSECSDFTEGGENKGTIRELIKSNIRIFLSGTLGCTFNTYKNELYSFFDKRNIVIEIPNAISPSISAILNVLLGNIIEIIGNREIYDGEKKDDNLPRHITVFEEAQLLFNVDDEDKIHSATTRKLEQLLSTARKFGESIIIANQDPNAIHKCILGNIRQRFIHKINASDVARNMAADYNVPFNEMISIAPHNFWFCAEDQYLALPYGYKIEKEEEPLEISEEKPNNILGYAGLDNINDQLAATFNFLSALSNSGYHKLEVKRFHTALSGKLATQCKVETAILPEYMAFLTCAAIGKLQGALKPGIYNKLKTYYANLVIDDVEEAVIPDVLLDKNLLSIKLLESILHEQYRNK